MKELIARLQASYTTLSSRERRLVAIGGAALLVFVVFLVTFAFSSKADRLRSSIATKTKALDEIQVLAMGFRDTEAKRLQVESQLKASNIRLISYLEEKATQAGIDLPTINPKPDVTLEGDKIIETAVELSLTEVKLNRLLDFLNAVESAPGGLVKVKYLRIEPRVATQNLTAWLTIATYKAKN